MSGERERRGGGERPKQSIHSCVLLCGFVGRQRWWFCRQSLVVRCCRRSFVARTCLLCCVYLFRRVNFVFVVLEPERNDHPDQLEIRTAVIRRRSTRRQQFSNPLLVVDTWIYLGSKGYAMYGKVLDLGRDSSSRLYGANAVLLVFSAGSNIVQWTDQT